MVTAIVFVAVIAVITWFFWRTLEIPSVSAGRTGDGANFFRRKQRVFLVARFSLADLFLSFRVPFREPLARLLYHPDDIPLGVPFYPQEKFIAHLLVAFFIVTY